jgi:hypothetical protein
VRAAFVVDQDDPEFDSDLGRAHVDFAARWSRSFGAWQLALSHFFGTGRDPRFRIKVPEPLPDTVDDLLVQTRLTPVYDIIHQSGVEVQHTGENLLLKMEAFGRAGQGDYRFAAVAGGEYTFYGIFGSAIDAGALGELLYDTFELEDLPSRGDIPPGAPVSAVAEALRAIDLDEPPSPFEHDIFVGMRLAFNDTQTTQILAGGTVDVVDGSRFWSIESSRRLGERFSISADLRFFDGFGNDSYFHGVVRDDFFQLRVAYFL